MVGNKWKPWHPWQRVQHTAAKHKPQTPGDSRRWRWHCQAPGPRWRHASHPPEHPAAPPSSSGSRWGWTVHGRAGILRRQKILGTVKKLVGYTHFYYRSYCTCSRKAPSSLQSLFSAVSSSGWQAFGLGSENKQKDETLSWPNSNPLIIIHSI